MHAATYACIVVQLKEDIYVVCNSPQRGAQFGAELQLPVRTLPLETVGVLNHMGFKGRGRGSWRLAHAGFEKVNHSIS